jgi:hypothetical protein
LAKPSNQLIYFGLFINQAILKMITEIYITEKDLAKKWGLSPKTLQRWRWLKSGPVYIKLGGRIRYTSDNIKNFEEERKCLHKGSNLSSRNKILSTTN